jgi:hypothetical protein
MGFQVADARVEMDYESISLQLLVLAHVIEERLKASIASR